jgi:hypothetical protein
MSSSAMARFSSLIRRPTLMGGLAGFQAIRGADAPGGHPRDDDGGEFRTALGQRCGGEGGQQVLQGELRIRGEGDIGAGGAADLLRHDLDMHDGHPGGHQGKALGRDLAKLAADNDEEVGLGDEVIGDTGVAAEQSERERVGAGDRALA